MTTACVFPLEPPQTPVPGLHWTLEPERLTPDPGVLKLNAVMAGITPYASVALLLVVSTAFTVVDVTVPVVVVVAFTV
jgi:hypothetical protein